MIPTIGISCKGAASSIRVAHLAPLASAGYNLSYRRRCRTQNTNNMTSDYNTPEGNIPTANSGGTEVLGMPPNTYCMLLHLSLFLGYVIPLGGLVAPIVMWAIGKDKSHQVDQHGKIVLNWIISFLIYLVIAGILCLVLIGFLFLVVLVILDIVFPIIGAVKASNGTAWKYPLSIPFFKVDA